MCLFQTIQVQLNTLDDPSILCTKPYINDKLVLLYGETHSWHWQTCQNAGGVMVAPKTMDEIRQAADLIGHFAPKDQLADCE